MKFIKKAVAFLTAFILSLPCFNIFSLAEGERWLFIDGENITRSVNTAVIYDSGDTTGQNERGFSVVIDAEGIVTAVYEFGDSAGNNIAIPENGAVISASGTKMQWLEDNAKLGAKLYYEGHTQRLFIANESGAVSPYINIEFAVNSHNGGYAIAEAEGEGRTDYTYAVVIDGEGNVISRGDDGNIPEGGYALYALTAAARDDLIACAPIGAHCNIADGLATVVYEEDMLANSLDLAIKNASAKVADARVEFDYVNLTKMDLLIAESQALATGELDYPSVMAMIYRLETELDQMTFETLATELRGAFHTPTEKNAAEVRATVLSAKAAGLNSLILRVPSGYGSYIPLPQGDRFYESSSYDGFDLLQAYIDVCKNESISLTVCIEVYYNRYAALASPEWLTQSISESKGLSDKYFSPENREFKEYFLNYVDHILNNYEIDSLMFDYLRYPKFTEATDLGYDYTTLERFAIEKNVSVSEINEVKTLTFQSKYWTDWVKFRSGLVTSMAEALSQKVRAFDESITLSVVAERDTVDHYYMQNATEWVEKGLFDGICVAFYESDAEELDPLGDNAYYGGMVADKGQTFGAYTKDKAYFFTGIESQKGIDFTAVSQAIKESRDLGADGFIFSDLKGLIAQNYDNALSDGALRGTVASPLGNSVSAMQAILTLSKNKIHDTVLANGGCDDEIYSQAAAYIDNALTTVVTKPLTVDAAKSLRESMALLFSASPAKNSVMQEYDLLLKLATLVKEDKPNTPDEPNESLPPEDTSGDEGSDDTPDGSQGEENTSDDNSADNSGDSSADSSVGGADGDNTNITTQSKININLGDIFIYGFVCLAGAAVIAAIVVSILRKRDVPKNHHMPKGSKKGYGEEKDK